MSDIVKNIVEALKTKIVLEFPVITTILGKIDSIRFDANSDKIISYNLHVRGFTLGNKFKEIYNRDKKDAFNLIINAIAIIGFGVYSKENIFNHGELANNMITDSYSEYDLLVDIVSYSFTNSLSTTYNSSGGKSSIINISLDIQSALKKFESLLVKTNTDDPMYDIKHTLINTSNEVKVNLSKVFHNPDVQLVDNNLLYNLHLQHLSISSSQMLTLSTAQDSVFDENVKFEKIYGEDENVNSTTSEDFHESFGSTSTNVDENVTSSSSSSLMEGDDTSTPISYESTDETSNSLLSSLTSFGMVLDYISNNRLIDNKSNLVVDRFSNGFVNRTTVDYKVELSSIIDSSFKDDYSMSRFNKPAMQRNIVLPGLVSNEVSLFIFIDASGSVSNNQVKDAVSVISSVVNNHTNYKVKFHAFTTKVNDSFVEIEYPDDPYESVDEILDITNISGGTDFAMIYDFIRDRVYTHNDTPPTKTLIISADGQAIYPDISDVEEFPTTFFLEDTPSCRNIAKSYKDLGEFVFYKPTHS